MCLSWNFIISWNLLGSVIRSFNVEIVPSRRTIQNIVNKFEEIGFVLDKKEMIVKLKSSEEKFDDIGLDLKTLLGRDKND